jgi:Na+/proline symporter
MNVVSFDLDFANRYNFWSGLTGGFFLAMAYFGTDQSQVQRYLSGQSIAQSRLGLLFNGMFKVPMQFVILFIGVTVFVFHLFNRPPVFFNTPTWARVAATSEHAPALRDIEARHERAFAAQRAAAETHVAAQGTPSEESARNALRAAAAEMNALRAEARALVSRALPDAESKDSDYVFIQFVLSQLPVGLIGLLIAVIFCAAMSSISSELAALGSTTMLDLWRRWRRGDTAATEPGDLRLSKIFTVIWGAIAVGFATFASLLDNLIEAVNILGSIFYGTMLGLFVAAFFVKRLTATPVLIAALVAQGTVATLFFTSDLGFLWYNVIGCALVVGVALLLQPVLGGPRRAGG